MLQFGKFIATRAALAALTLVIISLVVFTLMELVPGIVLNGIWRSRTPRGRGFLLRY